MPDRPDVTFVAGQLGHGGAERQLYYMVRELVDAGVTPTVISMTAGDAWESPLADLGVAVRHAGRSRSHARRCIEVVRLVRQRPTAVVQSAHFQTNLYTVVAARATGAREIGAIRNDTKVSVQAMGVAGRPSLRLPRLLAANSQRAIDQAVELGVSRGRLALVRNVVDTDAFRPTPRPATEQFRLLSVGRLVAQKRHDRFLRVTAALVARSQPNTIAARVVGTGPLEGDLRRLAGDLGIADCVEFTRHEDPATAYPRADTLVLASDHEGTPNVILEAMACSLPVVTTDVGDVSSIIADGVSGRCVQGTDEDELLAALVELRDDHEMRAAMGAAARRTIESGWSTSTLLPQLDRLYASVRARSESRCAD